MKTVRQLTAEFAALVSKATNTEIEVTFRQGAELTISGLAPYARKASAWLESEGFAKIDSIVHDDEIGETFVYMTQITKGGRA
jgi:hypothetical protein